MLTHSDRGASFYGLRSIVEFKDSVFICEHMNEYNFHLRLKNLSTSFGCIFRNMVPQHIRYIKHWFGNQLDF